MEDHWWETKTQVPVEESLYFLCCNWLKPR